MIDPAWVGIGMAFTGQTVAVALWIGNVRARTMTIGVEIAAIHERLNRGEEQFNAIQASIGDVKASVARIEGRLMAHEEKP